MGNSISKRNSNNNMSRVLLSNSKVIAFNNNPLISFKNLLQATSLKAWYATRLENVVADNTAIQTPFDFSGNGTVLTQATSGARPKYRTNIINGLPVWEFDGSDDRFTFSSTSLTQNKAGLTTYIVWKRSSGTGANQSLFTFVNNASSVRHGMVINTGASFDQMFASARRVTESGVIASWPHLDTQFHVAANVANYATDLLSLYLDGELKAATTIGGSAGTNSQNAAATAGNDGIGSQGASGFLNGYIAEFIFCDAAHSAAEVVDIMSTLRRVYGGLPQ